jgi:single-strand DNA-binding protein
MSSFNQVVLIGNCGKDPEVFRLGSKPPFAKLQLATNKTWKKEGVKHSRTDWHAVILNRKLAEIAEQYLHSGDKVLIHGELMTRNWQDKEGNKRLSVFVQAKELRFLTLKPEGAKTQSNSAASHSAKTVHEETEYVANHGADEDVDYDDVAF